MFSFLIGLWSSLNTWLFPVQQETINEPLTAETSVQDNSIDAHFDYDGNQLSILPEQNTMNLTASMLSSDSSFAVTEADLENRKAQVERLLTEGVTLSLDGKSWTIPAQLKDLSFSKTEVGLQMRLNQDFMNYLLKTAEDQINTDPQNLTLLKVSDGQAESQSAGKPFKVDLSGSVVEGKKVSTPLLEIALIQSIQEGQTAQEVPVIRTPGKVLNQTGLDLGSLEKIGEGKSTFWGSSPEREFNIKKALNEKFNGIIIPAGAEFSYVDSLGPIEYGGWKQAYTIFQGTKLEKAPAGGVCQVSTTVYRAALDAALDITEQRNHSLYVIYYNDYGDGLDATIFPGEQDFKFVNNTPGPILMTTTEEGYYEAVVRFYGEDDGRETTLVGPYTASTQTDESKAAIGNLGIGQIAWKYSISHKNGKIKEEWLISDYMSPALQHRGETPSELDTRVSPPHP